MKDAMPSKGKGSIETNCIQTSISRPRQQSAIQRIITIIWSRTDDNEVYLKNFLIDACFPAFTSLLAFFFALLISCSASFEL